MRHNPKRSAAVLGVVAVLLLGAAGSALAAPYPGDVNSDGTVNLADLQAYSAANPSNTVVADIVKNWGTTAPVEPTPTPGQITVAAPSTDIGYLAWGEYTAGVANVSDDWSATDTRAVFHFDNVQIPKGSTVTAATFTGTTKTGDPAQGNLITRLHGVAADNQQEPTTAASIAALPLTTARTAQWTSTSATWTGSKAAPSVLAVVQEIVNRANWVAGNDIVIASKDDGSGGNGYFPLTSASMSVTFTAPAATTPTTPPTTPPATVGMLSGNTGRPFSSTGPWNTPLPASPALDPQSSSMIDGITPSGANFTANLYEFGNPVYNSTSSDPLVTVNCLEDWGTCDLEQQQIRIPASAVPAPGSDGAMVVVDFSTGTVYDFWQAAKQSNTAWTASWGTSVPLTDDNGARNTAGGSGATGAGFNVLAGTVRTFEIANGVIPHALTFSSNNSCTSQVRYPATKTDGNKSTANCIPEGARVQLDPSINVDAIPGITAGEKAVAKALQTYGAFNRDNGGAPIAIAFEAPSGEADPYPAAGFPNDYWDMPHIDADALRVVASSVTPAP